MLVTLRAGNTVDGPYRADNNLIRVAAQHGYIVVTPMTIGTMKALSREDPLTESPLSASRTDGGLSQHSTSA